MLDKSIMDMGGMLRQSGRTGSPQGKKSGKVDIPPQMVAGILIKSLKEYATELQGRTKKERDMLRVKLQNDAVDSLDLPAESKAKLKELLAVRIPIIDNIERSKHLGSINSEEAFWIFEDLKKQLEEHGPEIFEEDFESEGMALLADVQREAAMKERLAGLEMRTRLHAAEDGPRMKVLTVAKSINTLLLSRYLGGELQRFNEIVTIAMQEYVNAEFPPSLQDVLEGL